MRKLNTRKDSQMKYRIVKYYNVSDEFESVDECFDQLIKHIDEGEKAGFKITDISYGRYTLEKDNQKVTIEIIKEEE